MLQFIIGRAASGKTYSVLSRAAELAKSGETPIILVPEQFTFECEKQVLNILGEKLSQNVTVLSFTRVFDEVNRITGGVCVSSLGDAEKLILMKKAIKSCGNELVMFGKYSSFDGFAKKMLQTVTEFKMNAVSPLELHAVAEKTDSSVLKSKLMDTAVITENFDALITEKFIDPSDNLTVLYEKLQNCRYFDNKTVFIDSFDGFTGQQYRIIERIISQSKNIFVTLNCDSKESRKYGIFANVLKMKNRISDIAKCHAVKLNEDEILSESHYDNESLSFVENYLYGIKPPKETLSGVTVCHAETIYDEAEFVARNIRRIVREKGARYRDFLICARDTKPYYAALKNAMCKNSIPIFTDNRLPLSSTPVAATVISAADLLCGIKTEKILKLYKSGVDYFTEEELSELENYVYVWDIEGKSWFNDWDMNPDGFVLGEIKEKGREKLDRINSLRKKAIMPIINMQKTFENTAKSAVYAIIKLLEEIDAVNSYIRLYKGYKESKDNTYADAVRQSYDSVIGVFDSILKCFGQDKITEKEFYESLNSAISLETIGVTPQSLDEVTFGAADRIRPARPQYVFVLGANQGVFPKSISSSGIFSSSDRAALNEMGIDIADKSVFNSINEEYLVYTNVCCANKELYITFNSESGQNSTGEPSAFLMGLCEHFSIIPVREPENLSENNLPETQSSAFSEYCKYYCEDEISADTLYSVLEKFDDIKLKAEKITEFSERPLFTVKKENIKKLLGEKIRMSPSKFDDFSRCRFFYFGKDALGIKSLQKSEFDVLQRGTLIHYILQRAIEIHGKKIADLDEKQISDLVDNLINEYLDSVAGYRSFETPRIKFIIRAMARSIKEVVLHIRDEFKNTDFEPVSCELGIGIDNCEIPALNTEIDGMGELELVGKIDRLDRYGAYVRVIDYKSGSRKFKLPDVLFGQNMQMLIYLYAVCKDKTYGGEPAGILYMPASRATSQDETLLKMNGLICDDEEVRLAMDRSNSGKFVSKYSPQSKNSFASSEDFKNIFSFIEKRLKSAGKNIFEGKMYANPIDGIDSPACKYCEFKGICRIEDKDILKVKSMKREEVLKGIEEWNEDV